MRQQLADAPAEVVVANHCYGLFELAAVYLSSAPPRLADAKLAIDAFGALVDGLGDRLGDGEGSLTQALAQVRLAYVQIAEATAAAEGDARRGHRLAPDPPGHQAPRLDPAPVAVGGHERHLGPHLDATGAVGDPGAVEPETSAVERHHRPEPARLVELRHRAEQRAPQALQWTILDRASSKMSVAPWSFRAGMSVLMSALGTTVSTA